MDRSDTLRQTIIINPQKIHELATQRKTNNIHGAIPNLMDLPLDPPADWTVVNYRKKRTSPDRGGLGGQKKPV